MPGTIEERVAYLEGKVEEHSKAWVGIRDSIVHLEGRINALDQKVDRFRDELSGRIDALDQKVNSRIDALEQKVNSRIDALEQKVNSRIDYLDQKFSKFFLWIIGLQMTIFLAIIATFLK